MIIKDMMPSFELYQPTQLKDAFALLDRYGKDAWKMAGGYDSLSWFKERIKRPKAVIDLSGIAEMKGIRETADGLEIGALTTLTEIERNPVIKAKYRAAGGRGRQGREPADPQRRHHRRQRLPGCALPLLPLRPALLPRRRQHLLRRHAGRRQPRACAVRLRPLRGGVARPTARRRWSRWTPSSCIKSSKGERVIGAEEFFIGPKIDITHMTSTKPEEILTAIRIPKTWANANFYFEKVADRNTWDFPLVNVAAAMQVQERHDRGLPHRLRRRQRGAAPAHGGRGDRQGQADGRRHRQARRPVGHARRAAA